MAEYIEREILLEHLRKDPLFDLAERYGITGVIQSIPAADVRFVVRGKWIDEPIKGVRYHCSVCQGRFDYTWHFCPNCGADMREPPKEE